MAIDPALIGYWENADGRMRFGRDDWLYSVRAALFSISGNGQTLTEGTSTYSLVFGAAAGIVGVWRATFQEPEGEWIDEVHYAEDGRYTQTWTLNGAFDSTSIGYYEINGSMLKKEERRGIATTGPAPGAIALDVAFGPDQSGTYSISGAGVLTLTLDNNPVVLNPV
jgi:hypothetical protein